MTQSQCHVTYAMCLLRDFLTTVYNKCWYDKRLFLYGEIKIYYKITLKNKLDYFSYNYVCKVHLNFMANYKCMQVIVKGFRDFLRQTRDRGQNKRISDSSLCLTHETHFATCDLTTSVSNLLTNGRTQYHQRYSGVHDDSWQHVCPDSHRCLS